MSSFVEDKDKPWKNEVRHKRRLDALGRLDKPPFELGPARSLTSFLSRFVFFSPGPLYLHGGFSDGHLLDFMDDLGRDVDFRWVKFVAPVFQGLEIDNDPDWNHVLWVVEKPIWPGLVDFVCSLALVDSAKSRTIRYGQQELWVPDPRFCDAQKVFHGTPPFVAVQAFGVDASDGVTAFLPGGPPLFRPKLTRLPPRTAKHDVIAQAWRNQINPMEAVQDPRQ